MKVYITNADGSMYVHELRGVVFVTWVAKLHKHKALDFPADKAAEWVTILSQITGVACVSVVEDDMASTACVQARVELLQRINDELADKPEDEQSIWHLDAEDGDMTEFPTMLRVIDGIMGVQPMDWDRLLK